MVWMVRATRAIGMPEFTRVHDLRRTFISFMAMQGVPRDTIKDIVGHVDDETYEQWTAKTSAAQARPGYTLDPQVLRNQPTCPRANGRVKFFKRNSLISHD